MPNSVSHSARSRADEPDTVTNDEHFRRFAAGLSHIVWRMNPDGNCLVAPRWAEITGVSERELQRDGWLQTIHPDDRARVALALRTSRQYGSHFDADHRLRYRDGSFHWVRSRGEPARNSRGDVIAWIGLATDIDAEKHAEAALREDEARLRMIIDAARVGIIEHDLRADVVVVSPLALELMGFDSGESPTFDMFRARIYPADRSEFARAAARGCASDGNGSMDIAFRAQRPNGSVAWVYVRGTYLFEGAGDDRKAVKFVGVTGSLTGHMNEMAERAMLSAVISSSSDAIVATTCDGAIAQWNASAERIFGFSRMEMLHTSLERLIPEDRLSEFRRMRDAALRGEAIVGQAMTWARADGSEILVSLTLSPIRDDDDAYLGLSAIIRDITQQRRLESEVAQGQKMQAVGSLAGGVAHDLNNLLTSVLVGVESASQSAAIDAETRHEFREMKQDCLRAAALIRQLLAVAKRQVINPRPCDPNELVHDLVPMLHGILGESVTLSTSYAASRGIFVDPAQIGQVMLNLTANARDAMPHGGALSIETRDDPATDAVVLIVNDSGTGMTPDVQAHIFEPFFTTRPVGQGTGLGLSTAYGIVAQSGGRLTFESAEGAGTSFIITLPAVVAPVSPVSVLDDDAEVVGEETILVVEDSRAVRDVIVRGLISAGFNVIEACHGADAMAVMEKHNAPIHLVLTDVVMPEMSGVDLVTHLRDWYPAIRVLFMSGYSQHAVETYGVMVSNTDLLQKPFELHQLTARIRRLLDEPPHSLPPAASRWVA